MSLDPSIDLSVDVLDEGAEDAEAVTVAWLAPLLPMGQTANARKAGDPLPFIVVEFVEGTESIEESSSDDVVSVHCLYAKGDGNANKKWAAKFADRVHRRMLLLGRHLEPVAIGGRVADIDYCEVFSRPQWVPYGDEQILRKVGRYRIGGTYAKIS